jgi:DNA-binding PadR family transcriptional regulator
MHGYEMITEIAERSNGLWRPSPGSLYPAIQLMEDEGLVTVERSGTKRLASLTDTGRIEADRLAEKPAPWDEVADSVDDSAIQLRNAVGQVMGAAVQVGQVGTSAQQTRAVELLAEVRRRLYAVLAEDEAAGSADADSDEAGDSGEPF